MAQHALTELAGMDGGVGDVAREILYDPPLPMETPQGTALRRERARQEARRTQQVKAKDLAARAIPVHQDLLTGNVDAVRDEAGAPLRYHDKRNNVAYDSAGEARKIAYDSETGGPVLRDPYESAPVKTDKQGNRYAAPKGLPWRWTGRDEDKALEHEVKGVVGALDKQLTIDRDLDRHEDRDIKTRAEALSTAVPSLRGRGDLSREEVQAEIDRFYGYDRHKAANRTTGFFSQQLHPEALAERERLDAERARVTAEADDFYARRAAAEERRMEATRRRELRDRAHQFLLSRRVTPELLADLDARVPGAEDESVPVGMPSAEQEALEVRGAGELPGEGAEPADTIPTSSPSPQGDGGGLAEAAKDFAVSFGSGSNALLKMVGDFYGLASGDMDNVLSRQGKEGMEYWQRRKSKALLKEEEERQAAIDGAEGELGKKLEVYGFQTTPASRNLWVGELAKVVREQAYVCKYRPAAEQLATFVVNDKGKCEAAQGAFDDWVIMQGMALHRIDAAQKMSPPAAVRPVGANRSMAWGGRGLGPGSVS